MTKRILKDLTLTAFRAISPRLKDSASILMYHSIGNNAAFFTVTPDEFEKQLAYIHEKKFSVISLTELVSRIKNTISLSNCIVITFDDGYVDNYEIAVPLLKKYNFPASIFIPTDLIGKEYTTSDAVTLSIMNRNQLQELSNNNLIELFPHTHTHALLSNISEQEIEQEVKLSTEVIKNITSKTPTIFSYPKGKFSEKVITALEQQNYEAAVTVHEGLVDADSNLFMLKRNSIDSSTTFMQFKAKISGAIELYTKFNQNKQ